MQGRLLPLVLALLLGVVFGCSKSKEPEQTASAGSSENARQPGRLPDTHSQPMAVSASASPESTQPASFEQPLASLPDDLNSAAVSTSRPTPRTPIAAPAGQPPRVVQFEQGEEAEKVFRSLLSTLMQEANAHDRRRYGEAAIAARQRILGILNERYGENSWQTRNAQFALEHSQRLAQLTPQQWQQVEQIDKLQAEAETKRRLGDWDAADAVLAQAGGIIQGLWGANSPAAVNLLFQRAQLNQSIGRFPDAQEQLEQVLAQRRRLLGEQHPDVIVTLNALGQLHHAAQQHVEATRYLQEAVSLSHEIWGPEHTEYAMALNNLAMLMHSTGNAEAAIPLLRKAAEIRRLEYGADNISYAQTMANLGAIHYSCGQYAEAADCLRKAVGPLSSQWGSSNYLVKTAQTNLALSLMALQQLPEAEEALLPVVATDLAPDAKPDMSATGGLHAYAALKLAQGKLGEAEQLVKLVIDIQEKALGPQHPMLAPPLQTYRKILEKTGRADEAATIARRLDSVSTLQ